jgi:hypothetical protein
MTRSRHTAALGPAAFAAAFALLCSQALATRTVSPLPPSAYAVRAVCPAPAPGDAACQAQRLVPESAQARAHTHPLGVARTLERDSASPAEGGFGLTPQDLHTAYRLPTEASSTQTIALVDAYNNLGAEEDLAAYDTEFGLPECTTANKCFTKVNQDGQTANLPFPRTQKSLVEAEELCENGEGEAAEEACYLVEEDEGWTVEMSLDIETAHAICQNCHIVLVEADSPSYEDLETAEGAAVGLHATEISNSWAGPECIEGGGECVDDSPAFNHPGVVITAAAGDDGYLNWLEEPRAPSANFPASSPHVIAVGGTRLLLHQNTAAWKEETVWNDGGESKGTPDGHGAGGGGCSTQFTAPLWQRNVSDWSSVGCGDKRAVADVSADADPYTGLAVYDSQGFGGGEDWAPIGGTSLASPLIASVFALAGGAHGVEYPAQTLYRNSVELPGSLHDVTAGSNGECLSPFDEQTAQTACTPAHEAATSCSSKAICLAGSGYDGPTGVGTPDEIAAFQPPSEGWGEESTPSEEKGNGGGGESPGSGGGGGGSSGGATGTSGSSGSPTGSSPTPATATPPGKPPIQLSGLTLTPHALIALNTSRPRISQLGFAFTINLAARVRVSLAKRVRSRGHTHWQVLGRTFMIAAVSGRNGRHLAGHGVLTPGAYRLTLAPVQGRAGSIGFTIG